MAITKKIKITVIVVGVFIVSLLHNPIHDLNLLKMKMSFLEVARIQPIETHFIWQKSYIGNLGSNGSWQCEYMVGELRSFDQSRENVVERYQKVLDSNDNINILFMDGDKWPLDSILWDWRGEFLDQNNIEEGKYYIVYISQKFPALLDIRCKI